MNVYFIGDLHLGHKGVLGFGSRNFLNASDSDEHDEIVIERICQTVGKRDVLWLMGDIVFNKDKLYLLNKIRCGTKYLVLGNHDYLHIKDLVPYFNNIYGITKYKNMWLSHCPIHPQEMYKARANIHGHVHQNIINDPMYISVCVEANEGYPTSLTQIKKIIEERDNNML